MNALNSLLTRFKNLTAIGKVKKIDTQKTQVQLRKGELKELERMQPYGFGSIPDFETDAFVIFPAGERLNGKVLAIQNKNYSIDLKPTEVAIYSQNNNSIVLKNDGTIELTGDTTIKSNLKVDGDLELAGNAEIAGDLTVENVNANAEVMVGAVNLTKHTHSNGNNGSPTGPPQ